MFPYLKTGGLADAVAALTGALADRGHELAVFLPGYRSVFDGPHVADAKPSHKLKVEMGDSFLAGDVYTLNPRPGLTLYLICREEFFDRKRPYWTGERDYDDNDARFIFFQKAVVELLRLTDFKADIVHSHDWQTGLLPLFLREAERQYEVTLALKTVFTIHNISYQGVFPRKSFALTNLPDDLMTIDGLEYYDQMCMLKGGIVFADRVTTVSPQGSKSDGIRKKSEPDSTRWLMPSSSLTQIPTLAGCAAANSWNKSSYFFSPPPSTTSRQFSFAKKSFAPSTRSSPLAGVKRQTMPNTGPLNRSLQPNSCNSFARQTALPPKSPAV